MKKLHILFLIVLCVQAIQAQVPKAINYQMTVRDNMNVLVTNQDVGLQFSILEDNASGSVVYQENHFFNY